MISTSIIFHLASAFVLIVLTFLSIDLWSRMLFLRKILTQKRVADKPYRFLKRFAALAGIALEVDHWPPDVVQRIYGQWLLSLCISYEVVLLQLSQDQDRFMLFMHVVEASSEDIPTNAKFSDLIEIKIISASRRKNSSLS